MPDEIFGFLLCLMLLKMYECILVNFLCKAYSKVGFGYAKISDTIFFWLLITTVLNDAVFLSLTHT